MAIVGIVAASQVHAGEPGRIVANDVVACTDRDYLDKFYEYARDNDRRAFDQALVKGIDTGMCVLFHKGDAVFVTDDDGRGHRKLRRKGGISEFWIPRGHVEVDKG